MENGRSSFTRTHLNNRTPVLFITTQLPKSPYAQTGGLFATGSREYAVWRGRGIVYRV